MHVVDNPAVVIAEVFRVSVRGAFRFLAPLGVLVAPGGLFTGSNWTDTCSVVRGCDSGLTTPLERAGFENVQETVAEVQVSFASAEEFWEME